MALGPRSFPSFEKGRNFELLTMRRFFAIVLLLIAAALFFYYAGNILVYENAQKSDVIVVLAGGNSDVRYRKGLEMLRAGYGKQLFWDVSEDYSLFGKKPTEYARIYVTESAGDMVSRVTVCPVREDSTRTETKYVVRCIQTLGAKSALIVTSDHHTRRALSTFNKMEPSFHWTVAAATDSKVWEPKWWQNREWAKMTLMEWERMLWWNAIDRWRK